MIDLKKFCATTDLRDQLHSPFNQNGFTFATNGHICVRTALRSEYPDQDKPDTGKVLWDTAKDFRRFDIKIPPIRDEEKEGCGCFDGREHDCPDCECVCSGCNGTGYIDVGGDHNWSIDVLGFPFALKYIRMISELPDVEIALAKDNILAFRFSGGDGLLMARRRPDKNHIAESKHG